MNVFGRTAIEFPFSVNRSNDGHFPKEAGNASILFPWRVSIRRDENPPNPSARESDDQDLEKFFFGPSGVGSSDLRPPS